MIRAGKLDKIIDIQGLTVTVDTMGSETKVWATATGAPTRAEYIPLKGIERIEANKVGSVNPARFRIRRWSGLTVKHQVVYSGGTFRITGIEDYNRNGRDMVIHAEEIL